MVPALPAWRAPLSVEPRALASPLALLASALLKVPRLF